MKRVLLVLFLHFVAVSVRPCAADALADDQAAIAIHIAALHNPDNAVRAKAAKQLRRIVAKYPGDTVNIASRDHGEAFWREKIKRIKPGTPMSEIEKLLPLFPGSTDDGGDIGGGVMGEVRRLDYHWRADIRYDASNRPPLLVAQEMPVDVPIPPKYSGRWINWYVNGRPYTEAHYRNGEFNGRSTYYYDNGRKGGESYYLNGHLNGRSRGWHRNGRRSSIGYWRAGKMQGTERRWWPNGRLETLRHYENDKPHGLSVDWFENGRLQSRENFRNGQYEGVYVQWHSNGQKYFEGFFVNGRKQGFESQWDERGVLVYQHQYRNGEIVSDEPTP